MSDEHATQAAGGVQKCTTFADFLRLLQGGALHAELSAKMPEIAAALENFAAENGGKAKGKLKLSFDFHLKKGVYEIHADYSVTLPESPRDPTIAWLTPDNFFSPQNPAQLQMFPRQVRDAYTGDATQVREASA